MPPVWIGLTVAFASALVTNTAYSLEHDAAAALPPLSPRRPFRSARLLLHDRRWLAAFGAETAGWLMYVAALLISVPTRFGRAAALGLAAGLLFADGDISAKLVGYGGLWLVAIATLIVAYATGTSVLQWAYQQGDALTAAGTATMVTNAVPIVAGFVLFGEELPRGMGAVLQVAALACLVASAVALGHQQAAGAVFVERQTA
jgi:hypothetical protein